MKVTIVGTGYVGLVTGALSRCQGGRVDYFRFQLSLRDIEELLLERGIVVSYESVRRWCDKFGTAFAHRVKAARRKPGSTWHLDELFVMLRGEPLCAVASR